MNVSSSAMLVMTLRTLSADLDVIERLVPGTEGFRAVQNARASLETLRRQLAPLAHDSGLEPNPFNELELHPPSMPTGAKPSID